MSALRRLRGRLRAERGMTVIELVVSVGIGLIVVMATFDLVDASTRASAEVQDRVDSVQRGRVAMEQITQRLRSQVCLDTKTEAVAYGDSDQIRFFSDLGEYTDTFTPEARALRYVPGASGGNGRIEEDVWDPADTLYDRDGRLLPPTRTRVLIEDVVRATDEDGDPVPFLRYYTFENNDPATPSLLLQPPLTLVDRRRVVKISVNFDSRPTRGPATRDALDTRFENDVYVRTADPSDPGRGAQCL